MLCTALIQIQIITQQQRPFQAAETQNDDHDGIQECLEEWFYVRSPMPFSWTNGWQNDAIYTIMKFLHGPSCIKIPFHYFIY